MNDKYCIALTTAGSESEAGRLANLALDTGLAACVQIFPIRSIFNWQGQRENSAEFLLLLKTRAEKYPELEQLIAANHSYETPEILQLPVAAGFAPYLAWIDESTKK